MTISSPVTIGSPGDAAAPSTIDDAQNGERPRSGVLTFGEWLRAELHHRGWTQTRLAQRMPMDRELMSIQSHISKWLRGDRRPSPKSCAVLATALELPLDELLTRAGHRGGDDMGLLDEGSSPVREHLIALIAHTPEERLEHLVPLFEWIYRESRADAH